MNSKTAGFLLVCFVLLASVAQGWGSPRRGPGGPPGGPGGRGPPEEGPGRGPFNACDEFLDSVNDGAREINYSRPEEERCHMKSTWEEEEECRWNDMMSAKANGSLTASEACKAQLAQMFDVKY